MKNIIDVEQFRARQGAEVRLGKRPTNIAPVYSSKDNYKEILSKHTKKLSKLQERLYASNDYALLVIFQALDAAGKDGVIRHVMSGVNPQGCQVFSFKQPSANELDHDFLWRTTLCLPERGRIGIFNRSYYEEVLVVRVHPEFLMHEHLAKEQLNLRTIWDDRYRSIVDHERHLYENGTRVVKFYLHVSREEQRKRLLARIEDPEKNWKFNVGDIEERKFWRQYQNAYQACVTATSTTRAPWYVVPADDKRNARLIVSQVIVNTLASLNTSYPTLDAARRRELQKIRKMLGA
jgi:PPK2 family polyphosphate:nucleotide phosphotransferase